MIHVTYGPVFCTLDLTASQAEDFRACLRVRNPEFDPQIHDASEMSPYIEFFDAETGLLFTGLVAALISWAASRRLDVEYVGWPHHPTQGWSVSPPPVPVDCVSGIELKAHQVEAVGKALQYGRGVIELATGGGKTECLIAMTRLLGKPRTLIVTPDCASMHQMYSRFVKRGFAELSEVGRLGDDLYEVDSPIVVAVVNSAYAGIKNRDPKVLFVLHNAEVLVFDESHHQAQARTWQVVAAQCQAIRRYGLSGTPYKDAASRFNPSYIHPYDSFLTGLLGPTIVYVPPSQLQDTGELAKCRLISFPAGGDKIHTAPIMNTWMAKAVWKKVYSAGVVGNDERNKRVCTIAANLADTSRIPLISVENLSHGRELQRILWEECRVQAVCSYGSKVLYVTQEFADRNQCVYDPIPIIAPQPKKRGKKRTEKPKILGYDDTFVQLGKRDTTDIVEHLRAGTLQVLIGSRIYDEALDIPILTDLINATGGKADQRYRQKVGRVLRTSHGKGVAIIWDPWDDCHPILEKHSSLRLASAESQGWPVSATWKEGLDWIYSLRASTIEIGECVMSPTEIEVSCELTIPVTGRGSDSKFMFVKPRVSLKGRLDDGDDLPQCRKRLSDLVKALFLQEALRQAGTLEEITRKGFAAAAKEYIGQLSGGSSPTE